MGNLWERTRELQLMDQRAMEIEISFSQISDEQLDAYNGASTRGDADFGENLELGRIFMHFYTDRKLGGDYHR